MSAQAQQRTSFHTIDSISLLFRIETLLLARQKRSRSCNTRLRQCANSSATTRRISSSSQCAVSQNRHCKSSWILPVIISLPLFVLLRLRHLRPSLPRFTEITESINLKVSQDENQLSEKQRRISAATDLSKLLKFCSSSVKVF